MDVSALVVDPKNPSTVYATTSDCNEEGGSLWKSTDGSTTWRRMPQNVFGISWYAYANPIAVDPKNPTTVYAATGGVAKSTDGGESWTAINFGLPDYVWVNSVVIDPQNPSTVYAATSNGGVFVITDTPED